MIEWLICGNMAVNYVNSLKTGVYAIASVFLVLQLVLAVQKYVGKPSMQTLASKPFARLGGTLSISNYMCIFTSR